MGVTFTGRGAKMIAVIISDIAGWLKQESRATISGMVFIIGLVGSFTFLRPEYCLEALTAIVLGLALKAGNENWSEFWLKDWVKRTELPLWNLILGKVLAALAVCLIHLLFVLPVLIIMLMLWGFTWVQLVNVLLTILIAALIVAGLGLCGFCLGKDEDNILNSIPVVVWIVTTALVPLLRPFNPFYFVWNILVSNTQTLTAVIHLINLGVAALSIWMAEYLFRKGIR